MDATVCPACGADDETGWSDETMYDGLMFPESMLEPHVEEEGVSWSRVITIVISLFLVVAMVVTAAGRASIYILPVLAAAGAAYYVRFVWLPRTDWWQERELFNELLTRARGDEGLAERLIEIERQRNPDAGRVNWLDAAIYRWDRRRR